MQLDAILMTRVIAIGGRGESNPFGRINLPDLIKHVAKRYRFEKIPVVAEIKPNEGTIFEFGYDEECGTIAKLTAYNDGLNIETRAHSDVAKNAIISMYEWLAKDHGLVYGPQTVKRWLYVTDLAVHSKVDLTFLHPALKPICDAMSEYNEVLGRKGIEFRAGRIAIDYDHTVLEFPQTPFTIERDKSARFEEGKFFSESPFPSEQHLRILEQFEWGLSGE